MHLQSTPLYGNSTGLEYFYVTAFIGSHQYPQALILDTGSSVAAVPCREYCSDQSCGTHINGLYEFSKSTAGYLLTCQAEDYDCRCTDENRC